MTEQTIELQILASDFKYTRFNNPCNCAISKAAKRHFKTNEVAECLTMIRADGSLYHHRVYLGGDFRRDRVMAIEHKFSPQHVIRTITLTKA